ncbi:hypothetical protein [Raoultella ornithinolytica]|uniref:hypothetical protein n=1 Tax=Raoultella ornithinolytica TaxID=54291 RepID=UPI003B7CA611
MTKLLDLDSILPPKKEIKLAGKTYAIAEMTVGLFAKVKAFEGKDIESMSMLDQVEAYAGLVAEVMPDVPQEVINRLSIPQLQQIFAFAMEQADEENEAASGEEVK